MMLKNLFLLLLIVVVVVGFLADKRLISYCTLESAAGSIYNSLESALEKLVQDVLTFVSAADILEN